ncbi:INO80 complex subunit E isoform X2 [Hypanus sabinus]|uniref:INO80 complex subunit E isoform X2 n=1 Tax=Hypanus sabinus TaxID=79690 RepID=UPI0028C3D7A6|nr:INO80 complex subunit E isoform X2 [Hypanus sabinus]
MSGPGESDYRRKYRNLKRKLKLLLYEQECFQLELRKAQRKFIKVSRDKSFLLDRLLEYENVNDDSSDSDATASSENSEPDGPKLLDTPLQKKKRSPPLGGSASTSPTSLSLQPSLGYPPSRSTTPTQSPYLGTVGSPNFTQFPSEYLSAYADPQGPPATPTGPLPCTRGDRGKREKRGKPPKGKRCKLPASLRSSPPGSVSLPFSGPPDPLPALSSKLPPATILSTVPHQMFSTTGEGSEDEPIDGDDDLVIDIPE